MQDVKGFWSNETDSMTYLANLALSAFQNQKAKIVIQPPPGNLMPRCNFEIFIIIYYKMLSWNIVNIVKLVIV